MVSSLVSGFEAWRDTSPECLVPIGASFRACDDGPPPSLSFRLGRYDVQLFAEGLIEEGSAATFFVQGVDDLDDVAEDWLSNANAMFADKPLPLVGVLQLLAHGYPLDEGSHENGNSSNESVDREASDDEMLAEVSAEFAFSTWCSAQHLPDDMEQLRRRFATPVALSDSSRQALADAAQTEDSLRQAGAPAVCVAIDGRVGLAQFAVDPLRLCRQRSLVAQLGLRCEEPVVASFLLAAEDNRSAKNKNIGAVRDVFDFDSVRFAQSQGRDHSSYATTSLLPKLVADLTEAIQGTCHKEPAAWVSEALGSQVSHGSFFYTLWMGLLHFMSVAADYCPICLDRHLHPPATGKLCPCTQEFCVFRYEEFLASVHVELTRDPSVVELHLALASAAVDGPKDLFEPFPPGFLLRPELRSRTGVLEAGAGPAEAANKNITALRHIFDNLPRVAELKVAGTDRELRAMLERAAPSSASSTYSLVQFVLGTSRLILRRVDTPEHRLPQLASDVVQYVSLSGSPASEGNFLVKKRRYGSKFGFHGSALSKWYSILRNGLRVLSNTSFMTSGARFGEGVYLARDSSTALHYCDGQVGSRYSCSLGDALQVLGIVEYINDPACHRKHSEGIVTVSDPDALQLRYLLVFGTSASAMVSVEIEELKLDEHLAKAREDSCRASGEHGVGDVDLSAVFGKVVSPSSADCRP